MNISEWRQGLEPIPVPTRLLWQWPREQGPTAATIGSRDVTTAQTPKWQWPCTKMNKTKCSQFWMEGSCFQEKFSWKFIIYVVCVSPTPWKYHRSPARVLHHSAPQVAQGFGTGEQRGDSYLAQILPTCSCRQASLSSVPLPLAVFSKEWWNFRSSCSIHPLFFQVSYAPSFILSS